MCSLKFLRHSGQGGTSSFPVVIDDSEDERVPYQDGLNITPFHHDYHTVQISKTEYIGIRGEEVII